MTTKNQALDTRFRQLAAELERARSNDLATYCPQTFGRALACSAAARSKLADLGSEEAIHAQLDQAFESLGAAATRAKASAELLRPLVATRTEVNGSEQIRYRQPTLLQEAELAYRQAIEQAEQGNPEVAERTVAEALRLYHAASVSALQGGLISNLSRHVAAAQDALDPGTRAEATSIVASLEDDLTEVRANDRDRSDLDRRIAAAGLRVAALMATSFGLGLDSDLGLDGRVFDPGPPGWAPGTFGPPTAPLTMRTTQRTADSLTVTWRNIPSNADSNVILRRSGDGPWEAVDDVGVVGEWQTYTDSGLQPDRLYCYRIRARNSYGAATTSLDNAACGYTRDGNDLTVGRAQLRIRVADFSNAGTNDPVRVMLSSPLATYAPSGNGTWLDYGPVYSFPGGVLVVSDDFDRGRDFTYDLNLTYLDELSDITMLSIRKEGNDQMAIAELALIINGVTVFDRYFGETPSTAQKIGNGSPVYTIFHPELRAHPSWPTSFPTPALQITNQELVERMEGLVGDAIHSTGLRWGHRDGGDWVAITRVSESTLRVTLDLEAEVWGPNLEVDVELDLSLAVSCAGDEATLSLTTTSFSSDVSFDLLHDIFSFGIVEFFDDDIERAINSAWQPISQSFDFSTGGLCPTVQVDQAGNLNFSLS